MIIINEKYLMFNIKSVHFADSTFDIEDCDSVTFHLCKNFVTAELFRCQRVFTSIIDLTQDLDTIWKRMDRKSTRYSIKRAQKDGIEVRINKDYDQFYLIYKSFIQKGHIAFVWGRKHKI